MNLPGFTADSSLHDRTRQHRMEYVAAYTRSIIEPQLRVGGGGVLGNKCDDDYGECYIDCSVRYPESQDSPNNLNADLRQGCFDSCDASHDLCGGGRLALRRITGGSRFASALARR